MDFQPKYRDMVNHGELQAERIDYEGNYRFWRGDFYLDTYKTCFVNSYTEIPADANNIIWLPTQDNYQEMLCKLSSELTVLYDFSHWINSSLLLTPKYTFQMKQDYIKTFSSITQLWCGFWYAYVYHKYWKDGKWHDWDKNIVEQKQKPYDDNLVVRNNWGGGEI